MESQSLLKSKGKTPSGGYGSVSYSRQGSHDYSDITYRRLDEDSSDDHIQIRFVFRKRDAVIVTVLGVMVFISILTTLLIGIPRIRAKNAEIIKSNGSFEDPAFLQNVRPATTLNVAYPSKSDSGVYHSAAVSTNCPECSIIAASILEQNGSAVDAAIAATICLSVVDFHHTGLAGGLLMNIYRREGEIAEVIDARETAPSAAYKNMFHFNRTLASKGGLSVAVPGVLKGLSVAHSQYGRLSWSKLVWPSVKLCEKGFTVGTSLALALKSSGNDLSDGLRHLVTNKQSRRVYKKGEVIKQPVLGRTLRILAEKGPEEFYSGRLAEMFVKDIQSQNGIVSIEDLNSYQVKLYKAVNVSIKGDLRLFTVPPPGSGALLALFLNIMEQFNLSITTVQDSVLTYHRIAEAMKFMYARRKYIVDPEYVDVQLFLDQLITKEYAQNISFLMDDKATYSLEHYGDIVPGIPEDKGTSHVSIVSPDGDAVSLTSTINQKFGAQIISESTGIIPNDEMDDFSIPGIVNYFGVTPTEDNYIEPGKRPASSMCPSIIVNKKGDIVLVTGAAGGIRITSSTAYVILRHLWLNESVTEATDYARIHYQLFNSNVLEIESRMSQEVVRGLKALGHDIDIVKRSESIVNTVGLSAKTFRQFESVGDRRGDARVDGV